MRDINYPLKMHIKKIFIFLSLLLLFNSIFLINVDAANAPSECPICGEDHSGIVWNDTNKAGKFVYEAACRVYGANVIPDGIDKILKFDINNAGAFVGTPSAGAFNTVWIMAEKSYDVFSRIGALLVTVYVLYDMFCKLAGDNVSPETLFLGLLKLLIGIVVILNGYDILLYGISVTNQIFDTVTNVVVAGGGNEYEATADLCQCYNYSIEDNQFDAILDLAYIWIPWLLSFITSAVISISCWARFIDILIRIMFAPLGMADMVTDGTKSSGWSYFRKLLASVLKGAVLMVVLKSYGVIVAATLNMNAFFSWAMPILLALVVIGLIFKTQSIADDILGG